MEDIIGASFEELQRRYKILSDEEVELEDDLRLSRKVLDDIQVQMWRLDHPD